MNEDRSNLDRAPSRALVISLKVLIWSVRVICAAGIIATLSNRKLRDVTGIFLPVIFFIGVMASSQWLNTVLDKWLEAHKPPT